MLSRPLGQLYETLYAAAAAAADGRICTYYTPIHTHARGTMTGDKLPVKNRERDYRIIVELERGGSGRLRFSMQIFRRAKPRRETRGGSGFYVFTRVERRAVLDSLGDESDFERSRWCWRESA